MSGQPEDDPDAKEQDLAAFREAMRDVRPRPGSGRLPPHRAVPPPRPLQREADERAVLDEMLDLPPLEAYEGGDTLAYQGPGVQDSVFRRLRRGNYRIEAELDLHGLNATAAKQAVARFLAECQDHNYRCVRIIHGKGLRSPNSGPVLKSLVDFWLRQRQDVLAFTSARPQDGGTGAVYVLLRRPA